MGEISLKQILIKSISDKLKSMEPGAFQNFCLDFLPLLKSSCEGLEHFGGTRDGKPRKGTPDLKKTLSNGKQIAVQCSIQSNYWAMLKDKNEFSKWKPCEDIDKCLEKLSNIQEIVLCSSQDIPTNLPNVKTEILSYAKNKTDAEITILSGAEICNFLIKNVEDPRFNYLFKIHLPEIYKLVGLLKEKESLKLAVEIFKEKPVQLEVALNIAREAVKSIVDIENAKAYALKKVDELKSRFERVSLPPTGKIVRKIPEDFLLVNPIGNIFSLLGVPKIGKTSLTAQYAADWNSKEIIVHWFDCPLEESEQESLVEDVLRNIWSCFISPDKATELAAGIIQSHSIVLDKLKYNLEHSTIFVLDNSEFLSEKIFKILCEVLVELKRNRLLSQIGFLFISKKGLKYLCPAITNEFSAPLWTQEELREFLIYQLPDLHHYREDKYLENLGWMSGGHPLVALALARKFLSPEQLILSRFKGPSLEDEDLTEEVKTLLFEDILKEDDDSLKFVLRLSALVHRANNKIINAITRVNPPIAKPFSLLLSRLYGTVIEGDEKQGYSISFIYKEVAKKYLDQQLQQEIYDAVSLELLKPVDNVLNAIEVTDGIFYAILAHNFERAFYWTVMLLQAAINKRLTTIQIKTIVDRIELVTFINAPKDVEVLPLYYLMLLSMAMAYAHIEDYEKACKVLQNIKAPPKEVKDEKLKIILSVTNEAAKIYRMFLVAKSNPSESAKILSEIDFEEIKKHLPLGITQISDFSDVLLSVLSIKQIPSGLLGKIIDYTNLNDKNAVADLMRIALRLGVKADSEGVNPDEAIPLFTSSSAISEILQLIFKTQYALQKDDSGAAINFIDQTITLCQKQRLWSDPVENVISQLRGDTYYKLGRPEAKNFYLRCIECLSDQTDNFDYAWANYRSGLLSEDPKEAEGYFKKSSRTFESLGHDDLLARSEGERGITLVQLDRPLEFVRIVEWMCRRYFLRNKTKFAPSVTMAMAQLTRLTCSLRGESVSGEGDKIYPEFERGVYARVLDIAKPQAGGTVAFYSLARSYNLLGNRSRKAKCLRTALLFTTHTQLESNSVPLVIHELLDEIIPSGNKEEIKTLIVQGILVDMDQLILSHIPDPRNFMSHCIFTPLDNVIVKMDDSQKLKFIEILDGVQKAVIDSDCKNLEWWLASINLRKARLGEVFYKNRDEKYHLWKEAYDYGIKSNNEEVIIQSGHYLGFFYCERYLIKELAGIQFKLIKTIPIQKEGFERLEKIAQDMFKLWRKLDFSRLSEHDLKAKHSLMDGAKILNGSGMSVEEAAPLMILLLFGIYQVKGEATDWAVKRIKELGIEWKIPRDIKDKIVDFLT